MTQETDAAAIPYKLGKRPVEIIFLPRRLYFCNYYFLKNETSLLKILLTFSYFFLALNQKNNT